MKKDIDLGFKRDEEYRNSTLTVFQIEEDDCK